MNNTKPDGRRNNGGRKCGGKKSKDGKMFYALHFKTLNKGWHPQVHRARPQCPRIGCGNNNEDKITELRPGCYQCDLCKKVWDISSKGL